MASPRVVYGFMHEIITSRINSPAFRWPRTQGRHQSGAPYCSTYICSYRAYRTSQQPTSHENHSAVDLLLAVIRGHY